MRLHHIDDRKKYGIDAYNALVVRALAIIFTYKDQPIPDRCWNDITSECELCGVKAPDITTDRYDRDTIRAHAVACINKNLEEIEKDPRGQAIMAYLELQNDTRT